MALTFPSSPTIGQQYTEGNKKWQWTGSVWDAVNTSDLTDGMLVLPTHATPDTTEASVVWNSTSDTVTVGSGLDSIELAKNADIPTVLTDLGIADGAAGEVLTTDGAGTFTFTAAAGGGGTLDSLTDVTAAGATNGQLLTADGAGNFTFTTVSGVSSTLAGLTDVTVAGETNGQVLTTDGAGNYSFTTVSGYTDADVATYLNGNLDSNIIPDTNNTYDIGSSTNYIKETFTSVLRVDSAAYLGNTIVSGDSITNTGNLTINAATDIILKPGSGSTKIQVEADIVPDTSVTYDVGKAVSRFKELHVRMDKPNYQHDRSDDLHLKKRL